VTKAVSLKAYNGVDNIETFDDWLMSVVAWIAMSGLGGPKHDESRVLFVGLRLSGEARTWYNDKVEGLYQTRKDWTFKDVIFGLYDQFIFKSSTHQAADKYYSIIYEEDKGFSSFYNSLTKYAHRMICAPDSYSFKDQMSMGMPILMRRWLIEDGINAESSSIEQILNAAQQWEEGRRGNKRYNEAYYACAGGVKPREKPLKMNDHPRKGDDSRMNHWFINNRGHPVIYQQKRNYESKPALNAQKEAVKPNSSNPAHIPAKVPPHAGGFRPKDPHHKPSGERSSVLKCFACGKMGHKSTDWSCSKYGQMGTRLNMIQDETGSSEHPQEEQPEQEEEDGEEPNRGAGGSQYSSEEGEWVEMQSKYECNNNCSDDEEEQMRGLCLSESEDEVVYLRMGIDHEGGSITHTSKREDTNSSIISADGSSLKEGRFQEVHGGNGQDKQPASHDPI
jgi:hypothetical protein